MSRTVSDVRFPRNSAAAGWLLGDHKRPCFHEFQTGNAAELRLVQCRQRKAETERGCRDQQIVCPDHRSFGLQRCPELGVQSCFLDLEWRNRQVFEDTFNKVFPLGSPLRVGGAFDAVQQFGCCDCRQPKLFVRMSLKE